MELYLIRHGETIWNAEKRYQGSRDIPLSEAGLRALRPADFRPDAVYVSKMLRTHQTARAIFPEARQLIVPGLEEMCFGAFEGRNYIEMAQDPDYRAWVEGNCEGRCPGGEDLPEFSARICGALEKLIDGALAAGEGRLVIVAHGGTQMAGLSRFGRPARSYHDWLSGNGKGYRLSADRWPAEGLLDLLGEVDFTC